MFNLRFKTFLSYVLKNTTDYDLINTITDIRSLLYDICNKYESSKFIRVNIHNRYNILLNKSLTLVSHTEYGDIYTILYNNVTTYFKQSQYNPNISADILSTMIDSYDYKQFIQSKYKAEFKYAIINELKNSINSIYTPAINNVNNIELNKIIDDAIISRVSSMIDTNYIISKMYKPLVDELVNQVSRLLNDDEIKTEIHQTLNTIINNYIKVCDVEYKEYITNNITQIINTICNHKLIQK